MFPISFESEVFRQVDCTMTALFSMKIRKGGFFKLVRSFSHYRYLDAVPDLIGRKGASECIMFLIIKSYSHLSAELKTETSIADFGISFPVSIGLSIFQRRSVCDNGCRNQF